MKQSLTIKTGQQLAMTPALRQGIELLNLPSLEIESKIQETLDSNIMLEEEAPKFNINNPFLDINKPSIKPISSFNLKNPSSNKKPYS